MFHIKCTDNYQHLALKSNPKEIVKTKGTQKPVWDGNIFSQFGTGGSLKISTLITSPYVRTSASTFTQFILYVV